MVDPGRPLLLDTHVRIRVMEGAMSDGRMVTVTVSGEDSFWL